MERCQSKKAASFPAPGSRWMLSASIKDISLVPTLQVHSLYLWSNWDLNVGSESQIHIIPTDWATAIPKEILQTKDERKLLLNYFSNNISGKSRKQLNHLMPSDMNTNHKEQ